MACTAARTTTARVPPALPPGTIGFDGGHLRLGGSTALIDLDDASEPRCEALIAATFGRRIGAGERETLLRASKLARSGDLVLAHLHLDLAHLSRVPDFLGLEARLALARATSEAGAKAESQAPSFGKYDADQPRVPPGSGRESGRWTREGSSVEGSVSYASAAVAISAARAAPLFAPDIGPLVLAALSSFFAAVGAVATLGVLFVPWQRSASSSGTLPGSSGATYGFDRDTGVLRVLGADGSLLATGQLGRGGVFYDVHTGVPLARAIDGAIVFNEDATRAGAASSSGTDARSRAREDTNKPKLCPAAVPDNKGADNASDRAKAYQEQIAFLVNGIKGLPFGLAIGLINPNTGRIVKFDECKLRTGDMIEAKGPGYKQLLRYSSAKIRKEWLDQSQRQLQAAGKRKVIWYFAERAAADFARQIFSKEAGGRTRIIIRVVPAVIG